MRGVLTNINNGPGKICQGENAAHGAGLYQDSYHPSTHPKDGGGVEEWFLARLSHFRNSGGGTGGQIFPEMKSSQQCRQMGHEGETVQSRIFIQPTWGDGDKCQALPLAERICTQAVVVPCPEILPFCSWKGLTTCSEVWKLLSLEMFQSLLGATDIPKLDLLIPCDHWTDSDGVC